jgi:glycyl-tRNA synthetase alpha subunit
MGLRPEELDRDIEVAFFDWCRNKGIGESEEDWECWFAGYTFAMLTILQRLATFKK